jgi:hypothetical protein
MLYVLQYGADRHLSNSLSALDFSQFIMIELG